MGESHHDSMVEKKEFHEESGNFGGIVIIFIGGILLLNNFGILPWTVWSILWRIWPLFLIVGGLDLLLGNSRFARFVITIITLIIVSYLFILIITANNLAAKQWIELKLPWLPLFENVFQEITHRYRTPFFERWKNEL